MAKKYNAAHLIHTFKNGDIVTVAIPAKDRAVNDAPRMEARIIDIPHENRHTLQTEYGVLTNSFTTSELNQVPAELAGPLQRKLTDISLPSTQFTIHKAAALRSPALTVPVKWRSVAFLIVVAFPPHKVYSPISEVKTHCLPTSVSFLLRVTS